MACCINNGTLFFKTSPQSISHTEHKAVTDLHTLKCSVHPHGMIQVCQWHLFQSTEMPTCLLKSDQVSTSKLNCAWCVSRHWSDISILVGCWSGSCHGFNLCQLLQTIPRHGSAARVLQVSFPDTAEASVASGTCLELDLWEG